MEYTLLIVYLACAFGFIMSWGVGANDLANIMSPTLGSKSITPRQAVILAILFEFAGAMYGSNGVSETISSKIIIGTAQLDNSNIYIYGMLAVLSAGTTWMLLASYLGLPVSITNTIIGGMVGFGAAQLGADAINWKQVGVIALSWITSPAIAGIIAYQLFNNVQSVILRTTDPMRNARRYIPLYLFFVGIILGYMIILKALNHYGYHFNYLLKICIVIGTGFIVMGVGIIFVRKINTHSTHTQEERFGYVEKLFSVIMAFTACSMIFAHGSNDVAVAIGPILAVIQIALKNGYLQPHPFQNWITLMGCSGVILGLLMYGRKVIETVGSSITALTPSRAYAATIAAAFTVILSTSAGIPVSATQTLVGAVFGVGLARGIGALNLQVIRNIFMSWIITIPVASLLAMLFFLLYKNIF
ncbi:MAG: hypothetical protein LEGION0398_MBIBDBAK_01235 [Legionellaceae bacterium]